MKYFLLKAKDINGNEKFKVYKTKREAVFFAKLGYHCYKHRYKVRRLKLCDCKPYSITRVNELTIVKGKH